MTQMNPLRSSLTVALSAVLFVAFAAAPMASAKAKKARSSATQPKASKAKASRTSQRSRPERAERTRASRDKRSNSKSVAKEDRRRAGRPLSRRERIAEARRLAEQRRREREEAARRAELARLARLAAIARQRAADQALRDETAANIARDDVTGEDMQVRRATLAALGSHAGSVVVMDPKTGRVYSIVNQEWALRRGYKPCSTIKLVTGLAGLSEKVIDPVQLTPVSTYGGRFDLTDALAFSNNGYFQTVGGHVGFDKMIAYARDLGLGEKTGVNHPSESPGRVPLYKTGYAVNHMSSHGDDFAVTPIQLATMVSAIANGGQLLTPHLPRTPEENQNFKTEARRQVNISADTLRRMVPGMIGAVNYGSGKRAYDPLQTVAGKTGTCIDNGAWLGLFTSYAPVADPRLAVVVVSPGSDGRNHFPAAVAGNIYRALNSRFGTPTTMPVPPAQEALTPHPKVDPSVAAASDEEAEEEAEAAAADANGGTADTNTTTTTAPRSAVKSVIMPVPSRPTEVTTRPVASPSTPAATPGAQKQQQQQSSQPDARPRRVLTTEP